MNGEYLNRRERRKAYKRNRKKFKNFQEFNSLFITKQPIKK